MSNDFDIEKIEKVSVLVHPPQIVKELHIEPDLGENLDKSLVRLEIDLMPGPMKVRVIVNEIDDPEDIETTKAFFDSEILPYIKRHLRALAQDIAITETVIKGEAAPIMVICEPKKKAPDPEWQGPGTGKEPEGENV